MTLQPSSPLPPSPSLLPFPRFPHPTQLFTNAQLVPLSMGLVVLGCLPAMVQQIHAPTPRGLLLCMANCAFSFYMLGYQVGAGV